MTKKKYVRKSSKTKITKKISYAVVHISATFNNTIISIADCEGNVITNVTAGMLGFKGSRKATPHAAHKVAERAGENIKPYGVSMLSIIVSGPGSGRESAIRALHSMGFCIQTIADDTPLPHNGCRARKMRRV